MTLPKVTSYEIKDSRSGKKIPVVNGVHLHSVYDPEKEAQLFVEKNKELLNKSPWIIFLGIGFGYHVKESHTYLQTLNKPFKIIVIEPNTQVYNDWVDLNLKAFIDFTCFHGNEIKEIYREKELIEALLNRPSIIAHPASFNLYKKYFSELLTYKSPNTVKEIIEVIEDKDLIQYLNNFSSDMAFNEVLNNIIPKKQNLENLENLDSAFWGLYCSVPH